MRRRIRGSSVATELSARAQRANPTVAEALLWKHLRGRQLDGHKFRRQHPVGPFILDFCCAAQRLIIEVDGPVHNNRQQHDAHRDAQLRAYGYQVLRVTNDDVMDDLADVLQRIRAALTPTANEQENR